MSELLINPKDLNYNDIQVINDRQLQLLLKKTPEKYVKMRPAKGGGQWKYVSGGYVRKVLNLMFGFQWSFEILDEKVLHGEVIVKGRLTCTSNGVTISKMQYGNKDIMCKKGTETPLSIGNDMKAAATDCLKKCAAELGIAADIYNPEEFREVKLDINNELETIVDLFKAKEHLLDELQMTFVEDVINYKRSDDYTKTIKLLESL